MEIASKYAFAYALIAGFCTVLSIMVLIKAKHDIGSEQELKYFRRLICANLAFDVAEFFWALINYGSLPAPAMVSALMSVISMVALAFCVYYWFYYAEVRMGYHISEMPVLRIFTKIPVAIAIVLNVASIWTGWTFYVDPVYGFSRGVLYDIQFPVEDCLILICSVQALYMAVREPVKTKRRNYLTIVAFVIAPMIAAAIDASVPTLPVFEVGIFISIFFVFISMQESQIFNDALTGLNNRRRADDYLDQLYEGVTAANPFYYFVVDANAFKAINDRLGHVEGDRALRTLAGALKTTCDGTNSFAARWGGDEFVIIAEEDHIESPEVLIAALRDNLAAASHESGSAYELTVSVGWAKCDSASVPRASLISEADKMLYHEKESYYRTGKRVEVA